MVWGLVQMCDGHCTTTVQCSGAQRLDLPVLRPMLLNPLDRPTTRVSVQGVESLWGDCRFIPADWGSQ